MDLNEEQREQEFSTSPFNEEPLPMENEQGVEQVILETRTTEKRRTPFRTVAWIGGSIGAVVVALVLILCLGPSQPFWNSILHSYAYSLYQRSATPISQSGHSAVEDVRWVYVMPPLPFSDSNQPLFPDRDRAKIEQLLQWIQQAKVIPQGNLTMPKRSTDLHVVMKNGQTIDVSPAWTCTGGKNANGNMWSSCTTVTNRMIMFKGNGKQIFVDSPALYSFLAKGYMAWMPQVPNATHPSEVQSGSSFQVAGQAWLSQKVTLSLKRGEQVIWSADVVPDHGAFTKQVTVPNVEPGDYELEYKGDQHTLGFPIKVTK